LKNAVLTIISLLFLTGCSINHIPTSYFESRKQVLEEIKNFVDSRPTIDFISRRAHNGLIDKLIFDPSISYHIEERFNKEDIEFDLISNLRNEDEEIQKFFKDSTNFNIKLEGTREELKEKQKYFNITSDELIHIINLLKENDIRVVEVPLGKENVIRFNIEDNFNIIYSPSKEEIGLARDRKIHHLEGNWYYVKGDF
jgi:hypothetical protein